MGRFDITAHNKAQARLICKHCRKRGHLEARCPDTVDERMAARHAANRAAYIARTPKMTGLEWLRQRGGQARIDKIAYHIGEQLKIRPRTPQQLTTAVCTHFNRVALSTIRTLLHWMESGGAVARCGDVRGKGRGRPRQLWCLTRGK